MGLEPTNLLTASQALYQLSYAPSGRGPRYQSGRTSPAGGDPCAARSRAPIERRATGRYARTLIRTAQVVAYPGAMARAYDVNAVEHKWQRRWADEGTYEVDNDDPRPTFYVLCMYPYPSGRPTRATSATTPSATCSSATGPCSGTACSRPSASTRSACRPRTRPSRRARTPGSSPTPGSPS